MNDDARGWLEAELERVWLLAETRLATLEETGLGGDRAALEKALFARPLHSDLAGRLAEQTALAKKARTAAPLGRLAARLELRDLELEALIIAIAPHLDEHLDAVFRHIQSNFERRGVDLALVGELLGLDQTEKAGLLEVLDDDRPLIALRLLVAEPPSGCSALFRTIAPSLDSLPVLTGRRAVSPKLANVATLECEEPAGFFATQQALELEKLSELASQRVVSGAWLLHYGPSGAGKRELAHRVAWRAGLPLLTFDPTDVSGDGDEQLRRAKREALLAEAVLYVGPCKDDLAEDGARALLGRFAGYPGPLILGFETTTAPHLACARPLIEIALPEASAEARLELWRSAVPDADVTAVAQAYRLSNGEIASIGRELAATGPERLKEAVERRLRTELQGLAERVTARASWDDLVLADELLERVRQLIDRHRHAAQVFDDWQLGRRVQRGRGVTALFSGPPGTGKTMLAQVIARELGLELFKVDLSQVVSKWVGETEKQLSRIFELAERAHAVLLFDEADALLAKRTKVESANDRYGNLAVNYLLQRFEDYRGVVILTTNAASALDDAMARRLTAHLRLEEPDEDERLRLWQSMLPAALPKDETIDLDRIAGDFDLTGGHIKNAALRAAFLAAREGTAVSTALLRRAAVLEMQDMGRIA